MADFEQDISALCDAMESRAKEFVVALALNMQSYIQDRTPVLTGRLRASIQPTAPLSSWQPGEPIIIGTNVEYARRIEYGFTGKDSLGRTYHEKGRGMFTQAVAAFDDIVAATMRQVQGGASSTTGEAALGGVIGTAEGAISGAVGGFIVGGPAGAAAGAVSGAEIGAVAGVVEGVVLGNEGGPAEGAAVGAVEGAIEDAISGGPLGAAISVGVGTVEGAVEGEALEDDSKP